MNGRSTDEVAKPKPEATISLLLHHTVSSILGESHQHLAEKQECSRNALSYLTNSKSIQLCGRFTESPRARAANNNVLNNP
jgi:hypothetical protein